MRLTTSENIDTKYTEIVEPVKYIYRIYTAVNGADTYRDPDDYSFNDVGYTDTIERAKVIANKYIKEHFFNHEVELKETEDGSWYAHGMGSYAPTIIIEMKELL